MRNKISLIEQVGGILVFIGLIILFAKTPDNSSLAALVIIGGIVTSITGGIFGNMPKLGIAALISILVGVIFYFFTDYELLSNFFIATSIFFILAEIILKLRKKTTAT